LREKSRGGGAHAGEGLLCQDRLLSRSGHLFLLYRRVCT
jgi:hypothetical protein